MIGATKAVTGDPGFQTDASPEKSGGSTLVHDLDNDRYLLFIGEKDSAVRGRVYAVDPVTAVATKIADIPAAFNSSVNRATYFHSLGGVAYLPEYDSDVLFMPTR